MASISVSTNPEYNYRLMVGSLLSDDDFQSYCSVADGQFVIKVASGITQQQLDNAESNYDNTIYEKLLAEKAIDKTASIDLDVVALDKGRLNALEQVVNNLLMRLVTDSTISQTQSDNILNSTRKAKWDDSDAIVVQAEIDKAAL